MYLNPVLSERFFPGGQMKPFASDLLERLVPILSSNKASASLLENTIETIGHLALVSPQQVSDRLQTAIHTSTGQGQDAALRGMCLAIKSNPAALGNDGRWLLQALSGCSNPSKQLIEVSTPVRLIHLSNTYYIDSTCTDH